MNRILIDLPETIETKRLILQMPKAGMGKKIHEAILDGYEDYIKWLAWPTTPPTVEAVEEDCRKHHALFILRDFIRYVVIEKETGQVLGRFGIPDFQANWAIPLFGISYFIRKSQRSKGYATEATGALVRLAFETLKAKKVEIQCDAENVASTMVPQKLGFKHEFTRLGAWPRPDDKLAEIRTYSMFSVNELQSTSVLP